MPNQHSTDTALAQGRVAYMLELARGGSHIASTRTPQTLERAITEVLDQFCQVHGLHALDVFLALLAVEVGQRGNREAVRAMSAFAAGGERQKKPAPEGRRKKDPASAEGQLVGQNPERRG